MNNWPIHATWPGPIVMIGFGSIGRGTLPLILRHIRCDRRQRGAQRGLLDRRASAFLRGRRLESDHQRAGRNRFIGAPSTGGDERFGSEQTEVQSIIGRAGPRHGRVESAVEDTPDLNVLRSSARR